MRFGLPRVTLLKFGDYEIGFGGPIKDSLGGRALNQLWSWVSQAVTTQPSAHSKALSLILLASQIAPASSHQVTESVYISRGNYEGEANFVYYKHEVVDGYKDAITSSGGNITGPIVINDPTTWQICQFVLDLGIAVLKFTLNNATYSQNDPFHLENMHFLKTACDMQDPNIDVENSGFNAEKTVAGVLGALAGLFASLIGDRVTKKLIPTATVPLWHVRIGGAALTTIYFFPIVFGSMVPTTNLAAIFFGAFFMPVIYKMPAMVTRISQDPRVQHFLGCDPKFRRQASDRTPLTSDGSKQKDFDDADDNSSSYDSSHPYV